MSPLRWTTRSLRVLAAELTRHGHRVSADTVADLLHEEGFSLQGNAKTLEGSQHRDRDAQFRYINEQVKAHQEAGDPVVSVDSRKRELAGEFARGGREWRPKGRPAQVKTHDFAGPDLGTAIPYGVYDVAAGTGWVSAGTDHNTAAFAVESIRRWWQALGQATYPAARRLLVTADAGGSNGYRLRAWKAGLATFALETGLSITVCHFPPGTSKWNKIEHRLFSHISMNWRGRPLTSHEVIINTIAATTTATGLTVHAELDTSTCPTGQKISSGQGACLPINRHAWHSDWNYTLHPQPPAPPPPSPPRSPRGPERSGWAHPALTGLTTTEWDQLIHTLTITHQAQRHTRLYLRRGGQPTRRPAGGHPPALSIAGKTLVTVLRLRFRPPKPVLAELFGVVPTTITSAEHQIWPLLTQAGYYIEPAGPRLTTLADLTGYAQAHGLNLTPKPKPAR